MDRPTPAAALAAARAAMSGPLVRGRHDCVATACAAFAALWGRDPLGAFRDSYATTGGAARLLRRHGGPAGLAAAAFAPAGLVRVAEPGCGDLAILAKPGGFRAVLALALGEGRHALKTRHGMAIVRAAASEGWSAWA